MLPQSNALSFPFTVHEVVRLGLQSGHAGVAPDGVAGLPDKALRQVDLDDYGGRFFQELSGGEQQRVHLARVLCQIWHPVIDGRARYLFLDEPTSSLDIRRQILTLASARDFTRRCGGVVAVLHDLNISAMFADRIVLMADGRVVADGPPGDVLADDRLRDVFGVPLKVNTVPPDNSLFVLPRSAIQSALQSANRPR